MLIVGLLFFFSGLLDTKPAPVFSDVYFGTQGPYRFLVDTGAETSLIDPALATKLGLQPTFRAEVLTAQNTRLVPGTKVTTLRLGNQAILETELLFYDVAAARRLDPSVKGLLGLSALTGFNFTLSPGSGQMDAVAKRPVGEVVPFYKIDGRMAVKARMGTETLTLILDSGSTHIVLFRMPAAMARTHPISTTFSTLDGARSVVPTCWTEDMFFTERLRVGMLPAAIVERKNTVAEGLLPASVFKKVYVDQERSELVLVR